MNTRSMSKLLTGVVGLLFTFVGLSAWGQVPVSTRPSLKEMYCGPDANGNSRLDTKACKDAIRAESSSPDMCEAAQASIETNSSKFSLEAFKRAKTCWGSEDDLADVGLDEDPIDSREVGSTCKEALTSSCKEENFGLAKTYQDDEKTAKDRIRDIKKDMIDSKKDLQQSQKDHKQKLSEIQESTEDAGVELKKGGQALLDKLEKENGKMDNDLREAKSRMQAKFNEWDMQYVEMRDAFRAAEQAIQEATGKVEIACRVEAQQRLDETNKRIKERTDGRVGKKFNRQTSRIASGSKTRQFADYQKLRQTQYAEAYKLCLSGSSPGGAAAAAEVTKAKANFERTKLKLADLQAVVENQRRQLRQEYDDATKSVATSKDKLAQQIQRLTQQQYEAYQMTLTRLGRQYQSENESFQNDMNLYNERQALTYQEMSDAQSEQYLASARLQCARANGGTVSESAAQRKLQKMEEADSTYPILRSACKKAELACGEGHASQNLCSKITGDDGGSSTSRSGRTGQ